MVEMKTAVEIAERIEQLREANLSMRAAIYRLEAKICDRDTNPLVDRLRFREEINVMKDEIRKNKALLDALYWVLGGD